MPCEMTLVGESSLDGHICNTHAGIQEASSLLHSDLGTVAIWRYAEMPPESGDQLSL